MKKEFKINFTGKTHLSDKEFINFYGKLWHKTPHYNSSNWPSDEQIKKMKEEGEKIYNSEESFTGEVWEDYPDNPDYKVSTFGRIKYKEKFLTQEDKEDTVGYLVLVQPDEFPKINTSTYVYTFVAKTFLGKVDGDGYHVHHIDNNGYNCHTDNLILLTTEQHKAVHYGRLLSEGRLKEFLNPCRRYSEEKIKLQLSDYKINNITLECGEWRGRKYSHILPDKKQNLITDSYKAELEKFYEDLGSHIHTYFSHLNSSQALCLNLFAPLIITKRLDLIDKNISETAKAEFEHTEQNSFEKSSNDKDKTNFDFFIQDGSNKYFFELKYTEETFSYVSDYKHDDKHDKKYQEYYKKQMQLVAPNVDEKTFFDSYQLWRNICHVTEGKVFFVILKDRLDLKSDIEDVKKKCKEEFRDKDKIVILTIEELVKEALKFKDDEKFYQHYKEFYEKYLNY